MQALLSKKELVILYSGLAILLVMILINTRSPFFDEVLYLRDVAVLHKYGFSNEFLLRLTGSAGPLYAVVHYLLEPITHLEPPYVRLVNFAFLLGVIYFLGHTLSVLGFSTRQYSLYCLAVPMTYLITGLALTEMPAMFFLTIGLYIIICVVSTTMPLFTQFFYLASGGICLGIAITGRQPYLLIVAALPILFMDIQWKSNIVKVIIVTFFSLALPLYIFLVWGDLVPPTDAILYNKIAEAGNPYRPDFTFLCLAYFAGIFLLMAPYIYSKPNKKTFIGLAILFIVMLVVNYKFEWVVYLPHHSVTNKFFLSLKSQMLLSIFSGTIMALISLYFLYTIVAQYINNKLPSTLIFYIIALLLIALSCAKITWGFSSRYPAQAIPLIIPIGAYFYRRKGSSNYLRATIGIIIGAYSLYSYIVS